MHQTLVEAKEVGLENWRREGGCPFIVPFSLYLKGATFKPYLVVQVVREQKNEVLTNVPREK